MKNKKIFLFFSFIFLFLFLFSFRLVLAGDTLGINEVDSQIALKATDPRAIATRIINIALGLLAVIAVSLAIYGGFIWMTSGGNEEKVSQAKRILKNAVIGLAIILASWGIVTFIFRSLASPDQTGLGGFTPGQVFFQSGLGAIGACSLESVYPAPRQKAVPRNTMIMATFKEEIDFSTISSDTVAICLESNFDPNNMTCSQPEAFTSSTNDNKIIVFTPSNYLGNENGFTDYIVYFSSDILVSDGSRSIFGNCANSFFLWNFEVSNVLDLTPPKISSIFPQPDNIKDEFIVTNATAATSLLNVLSNNLNYYQPASLQSITNITGTTIANVFVHPTYNGSFDVFRAVIDSSGTKAQLFGKVPGGNDVSLGVADILGNNSAEFLGYLKLMVNQVVAGNSWDITVNKMTESDYVQLELYHYRFTNGAPSYYSVKIGSSISETTSNIINSINDNSQWVEAYQGSSVGKIDLKVKISGTNGNLFSIGSSDTSKISFTPFSGGTNKTETVQVNDKKDKPMNSTIQINFNEAINPLMVSGESYEVEDTIRVRNLSDNSLLTGRFVVSSDYKTVEFRSDFKCGVNACGEDIFCLPANSRLMVEIMAAELFNCSGNNNLCANKSPFSSCINNICTNDDGKFYPLSDITLGKGIMDAAANSFDGNGDGYADGPESYYYKNTPIPGTGDNFYWSFWINDQIDTDPPQITSISPGIGDTNVDLWSPIKIGFNKLMMASTLRTGDLLMSGAQGDIQHRLINLLSGQLVGYWIGAENVDLDPLDGEPDKTNAYVNHAQFYEGASYSSQVGSGVKDIYQNCFKPSVGLDCEASTGSPYCCDGVTSATPCSNPY
jgi:hypothetical protein